MEQRSALIFGASGLVGSYLLDMLISSPNYHTIISVGRKQLELSDPKLLQVIADIDTIDAQKSLFMVQDIYCCLGTTIKKAKSRKEFKKTDFEYVLKIANLSAAHNAENFAVISSIGANKNTGNFYLRTKGEMEEALSSINFKALYIFRPSILLGKRKEFRFGELTGKFLIRIFSFLLIGRLKNYQGIHAKTVATSMIRNVLSGKKGIHILESNQIKS